MRWEIKKFEELSTIELYRILQLRIAIFSVEQNCPYQDADGKDLKCFHLMGYDNDNDLIAYSRIVPAGISFEEVSIGRVVSSQKARGTGAGKELMNKSIQFIEKQFGKVSIRIGAQCYLIKFYSGFGFEVSGDEYLEDNIPHIEMIYSFRS
ncbi:MAG: GNAT family N-acetyltransferase [Bacteroidetes bacterium]|nr:GNAT family N-acetyltransferase [Bacteroidota bacterium]